MTFTYVVTDPDDISDISWVRFYSGDTTSPGFVSDEEITMLVTANGGWKLAVIPVIRKIIFALAQEDGAKLDWLEMDRADAMKYYKALIPQVAADLGLSGAAAGGVSSGVVHTSRNDRPSRA